MFKAVIAKMAKSKSSVLGFISSIYMLENETWAVN